MKGTFVVTIVLALICNSVQEISDLESMENVKHACDSKTSMCFRFFPQQNKNWFKAKEFCETFGDVDGQLAVVNAGGISKRIRRYINNNVQLQDPNGNGYWIDGNDQQNEVTTTTDEPDTTTTTDEPDTTTTTCEPDTTTTDEPDTTTTTTDEPDTTTTTTDEPVPQLPDTWTKRNWHSAQSSRCTVNLIVPDAITNAIIVAMISTDENYNGGYWIGVYYSGSGFTAWNGQPLMYTNWFTEPSNTQQNNKCVEIRYGSFCHRYQNYEWEPFVTNGTCFNSYMS
uniref:Uncharacterized protein LOC100376480 n=1 Tax=Saccoglossus kowalevskii TaxID=10224 RepID=A0ABM0MIC8_SACKO|nr:PREDICTED: uncharacterized protein LOC100376480 [Saccoglossus kowalevskii]